MFPFARPLLFLVALATLLTSLSGCAEVPYVPASDIIVSKGPDGETVYSPRTDTAAASGLAQYLQLKVDFKGISRDGYYLDTQLANLHGQSTVLTRAMHFNWRWQDMGGKPIDLAESLAEVKARIKTLDVNG